MPLRLVRDDETPQRRDFTGAVLALVFIAVAVGLARWGDWWWFVAVPLLLLGVPGLIDSLTLAERDDRGRRIRPEEEKKP